MQRLESSIVCPLLGDTTRHHGPSPFVKLLAQRLGVDPDARRDLAQGLAGLVSPARITKILRRPFRGHVYNLQTNADGTSLRIL